MRANSRLEKRLEFLEELAYKRYLSKLSDLELVEEAERVLARLLVRHPGNPEYLYFSERLPALKQCLRRAGGGGSDRL